VFDAKQVVTELGARGVRTGTASSVRAAQWDAAEIYPRPNNPGGTITVVRAVSEPGPCTAPPRS
jgi:hypothetical protein